MRLHFQALLPRKMAILTEIGERRRSRFEGWNVPWQVFGNWGRKVRTRHMLKSH